MTGIISGFGLSGAPSQLILGIQDLTKAHNNLEVEAATGVVASNYADLGPSITQALALQPALTQIGAWNGNITNAQNTLSTTQTALTQISAIAANLTSSLSTLGSTLSYSTTSTAASGAKLALTSLTGLLNTKQGNSYIFAGQDQLTAPVATDLGSSTLAAQIKNAVAQLPNAGATSVLSATDQLANDTTAGQPYSASLSTSPQDAYLQSNHVITGTTESMPAGIVATQGPQASSATSPIRSLVRNLMVVASLGDNYSSSMDYTQLVSGLVNSMSAVTSGLGDLSGLVGVQQNSLTAQSSMLKQMSSALQIQLGNTKNADLAAVSTQITDTNNQLQASYSLIADMKGMTLASYL